MNYTFPMHACRLIPFEVLSILQVQGVAEDAEDAENAKNAKGDQVGLAPRGPGVSPVHSSPPSFGFKESRKGDK